MVIHCLSVFFSFERQSSLSSNAMPCPLKMLVCFKISRLVDSFQATVDHVNHVTTCPVSPSATMLQLTPFNTTQLWIGRFQQACKIAPSLSRRSKGQHSICSQKGNSWRYSSRISSIRLRLFDVPSQMWWNWECLNTCKEMQATLGSTSERFVEIYRFKAAALKTL